MVSIELFVTVSISLIGLVLVVGLMAVTTKTVLQTSVQFININLHDLKEEIERVRDRQVVEVEKLKIEYKVETDRLREDLKQDITEMKEGNSDSVIRFTDALAKLNNTLTQLNMTNIEVKGTLERVKEQLKEHNDQLEKLKDGKYSKAH